MPDVREKLVELLWEYDQLRMMRMSIEESAEYLIANGVTIQRWIPVTERLPEEQKNVIAYTDVGSFAETAHWTGYRWEKTWDFEVLYGVTHWMPLPEPPKGE